MTGMKWAVQVRIEPRDLWIGVYWNRKPKGWPLKLQWWDIYICIIPTVVIHIFQYIDGKESSINSNNVPPVVE